MSVIGCLGDVIFKTTEKTIKTIENGKWGGSVRYGTHDIHLGDQLLEYEGMDVDTFSFDITLSAFLGTDPMTDIVTFFNYERKGAKLPLVLGTKVYGKNWWVIKKHKTSLKVFDGVGNLVKATVSLDLLGYVERG